MTMENENPMEIREIDCCAESDRAAAEVETMSAESNECDNAANGRAVNAALSYGDRCACGGKEREYDAISESRLECVLCPSRINEYEKRMCRIDNTLELCRNISDKNDFEGYENRCGKYKVRFAVNTADSDLVSVEKSGYKVWLRLIPKELCESLALPCHNAVYAETAADDFHKDAAGRSRRKINSKLYSAVRYAGLYENTDIVYEVTPGHVKENIVIHKRAGYYDITFCVTTRGLEMRLASDGSSVEFVPDAQHAAGRWSTRIFSIPAAYMYDRRGRISYDVKYRAECIGANEYILKIVPDHDWIDSGEREFPVVIDPTVLLGGHCDPA